MSASDEESPTERVDLRLRPADPSDPPDLLREIVDELKSALPQGVSSGRKWLTSKADQEWARAYQIKQGVLGEVARLQLERARFDEERRETERRAKAEERAAALEAEKVRLAHEEAMYERETQRLLALNELIKTAAAMRSDGMGVEVEAIVRQLLPGRPGTST